MFGPIAKKVFGTRNDRYLKTLRPLINHINELETRYQAMGDDELKSQTVTFRERIANGEQLHAIQAEAFAVAREASRRVLGMRHFDVQLIGGAVLNDGKISEMRTGEGKTLMATLAAYLNALSGKGVHVVTVNDYLAKRDAEWMGRLYNFLGLSVGVVIPSLAQNARKEAYAADITYGQNNEFGFDYLRDNLKFSKEDFAQRGHNFAIVDEVDSILIDEARTPLIISGPAEDSSEMYIGVNKIIPQLQASTDFEVDQRSKQPSLTEAGIARCEQLLGVTNLYDPKNIDVIHHVNQALAAHHTKQRDVDYVVAKGEIVIVDEFTGRLMPGRSWSNGLHQAIEAKENLVVRRENQTVASVTFQNFFRLYSKLSGMTGTADTEAAEFKKIYNLEVIVIPTNQPMIRRDETDRVYRTRPEKLNAAVEDIAEVHATGQPILVGTISIEQSEELAKHLQRKNIPHTVLNAKHHEKEAEIISQAGRFGAVTIATNMAGRGTDIILGGNPEGLAAKEAGTKDKADPAFQAALEQYKVQCAEEQKKVREAGGLFVLGTERHESRRIDNQLRGRSGRQGDPGASRFYISLEDELMQRFGGERLRGLMEKMGWEEGVMLDGRLMNRAIEKAQQRVEGMHFDMRKNLIELDDVMNKQRQVIYDLRNKILTNDSLRVDILGAIDDLIEGAVMQFCVDPKRSGTWDTAGLEQRYVHITGEQSAAIPSGLDQQAVFDLLRTKAQELYNSRATMLNAKLSELEAIASQDFGALKVSIGAFEGKNYNVDTVEKDIFLETLDHFWNLHLREMDHLREGIDLRGYGQKNPVHEYQKEGFLLFEQLIFSIKENVVRRLYFYEVPEPAELLKNIHEEIARREALEKQRQTVHQSVLADAESEVPATDPSDAKNKREELKKLRRKLK